MSKLILHIPHVSTNIPYLDGYKVNENILNREILWSTDWFVDEIFQYPDTTVIKPDVSRIFCDMERFEDDEQEPMSKEGRGVLYTHSLNGSLMRDVDTELRRKILDEYYYPHHKLLTDAATEELNSNGVALIVDCHSFPSTPHHQKPSYTKPRPDICIGTNDYHTPKELIDFTRNYFVEQIGMIVNINDPYNGTIVPKDYLNNDRRILSIMIEVNRSLYMNEKTGERKEFIRCVKNIISHFLEALDGWYLDYSSKNRERKSRQIEDQRKLSGFMRKINGMEEMDDETMSWWMSRY